MRESDKPVGRLIVYFLRDVAVFVYTDWMFYAAGDFSIFVLMWSDFIQLINLW